MVLIFSRPCCSVRVSKWLNSRSSSPTTSAAGRSFVGSEKPTTSAKSTDAAVNWSAMVRVSSLRRSAIEAGRMFRSSPSARCRSDWRAVNASSRSLREQREQRERSSRRRRRRGQAACRRTTRAEGTEYQRDSDDPRRKENRDEGDEPPDTGAHTIENQRAERGEDPPDPRRAAGEEPAEGDHRQRRRQQDVPELDGEKLAVIASPGEQDDGHDRNRRIQQRHEADHAPKAGTGRPTGTRSAGSGPRCGRAAPCGGGFSSSSAGSAPTFPSRSPTRPSMPRRDVTGRSSVGCSRCSGPPGR